MGAEHENTTNDLLYPSTAHGVNLRGKNALFLHIHVLY